MVGLEPQPKPFGQPETAAKTKKAMTRMTQMHADKSVLPNSSVQRAMVVD